MNDVVTVELEYVKDRLDKIEATYVTKEVFAVFTKDLGKAIKTIDGIMKWCWIIAGAGITLWAITGGLQNIGDVLQAISG